MPRVQKHVNKGLACLRDKNLLMSKLVIKVLHPSQMDIAPFGNKNVLRQVAFNSSVLEEPTKVKYFDKERMCEVQMERCADMLYCKI